MFITVKSYEELGHFAKAFGEGKIPLLLVVGAPGTSKTETIRRSLKRKHHWIDGQISPISLYMKLFDAKDRLVVIDDTDSIYGDKAARGMIKALCQTVAVKRVSWETQSRILTDAAVPRSFLTKSKVCIIANEWNTLDQVVKAIEDRAIALQVEPTPVEMHKMVATWFEDQEAFDFVGSIAHLIEVPSIRNYLVASDLRRSGHIKNWRDAVLRRCVREELRAIWEIKQDGKLSREKQAERFRDLGLGSRATYFRQVKKLPEPFQLPTLHLPRHKGGDKHRVTPVAKSHGRKKVGSRRERVAV